MSGQSEAVDVIEDITHQLDTEIPTFYLRKCEWMTYYTENTLTHHTEVSKDNIEKYVECFILHNGLVKLLKEREDK